MTFSRLISTTSVRGRPVAGFTLPLLPGNVTSCRTWWPVVIIGTGLWSPLNRTMRLLHRLHALYRLFCTIGLYSCFFCIQPLFGEKATGVQVVAKDILALTTKLLHQLIHGIKGLAQTSCGYNLVIKLEPVGPGVACVWVTESIRDEAVLAS